MKQIWTVWREREESRRKWREKKPEDIQERQSAFIREQETAEHAKPPRPGPRRLKEKTDALAAAATAVAAAITAQQKNEDDNPAAVISTAIAAIAAAVSTAVAITAEEQKNDDPEDAAAGAVSETAEVS